MASIIKTTNDDDPIIPNEIISKNERKKERRSLADVGFRKLVVGFSRWIKETR
jgi:hypothetical protein